MLKLINIILSKLHPSLSKCLNYISLSPVMLKYIHFSSLKSKIYNMHELQSPPLIIKYTLHINLF